MRKILIVVDMQNDFIDGSLGIPARDKDICRSEMLRRSHSGET